MSDPHVLKPRAEGKSECSMVELSPDERDILANFYRDILAYKKVIHLSGKSFDDAMEIIRRISN